MNIVSILSCGATLFFAGITVAMEPTVIPYNPAATGLISGGKYTVSVNGTDIPVMTYAGKSYAWFSFGGTIDVTVTYKPASIASFTVSPKRTAPIPVVDGKTLTFSLSGSRYFIVRDVNGDAEPLAIFADPLESNPPAPGGAPVFNILSYSADPTGVKDSTIAFQNAINAAHANPGGGTVFAGPGKYKSSSTITIKSNVQLYLAPGSILFTPPNANLSLTADAPVLIEGNNAKLTGRGILYGNGTTNSRQANQLVTHGDTIMIDGIMILDSETTGLRLTGNYQTVNGIKMLSASPRNSDGIDIDSGTNFHITNNYILSSDDTMSVGYAFNQWGYYQATNTVSVTGNLFWHTNTGALLKIIPCSAIPSVSNVTYDNNDAIGAQNVVAIYPVGTISIHDITFKNSRVEEVRDRAFDMLIADGSSWNLGNCQSAPTGSAYNINIENVMIDNMGPQQSRVYGASGAATLNNINFDNVTIGGTHASNEVTANMYVGPYAYNVSFNASSPGVTIGELSPSTIKVTAGKNISYTTAWRGGPTAINEMIFLHFVDSNGTIAFQDTDHYPSRRSNGWAGAYTETRSIAIPASATGTYRMLIGLFDPEKGNRLVLTPGPGVIDNGDTRYQVATAVVQPGSGCVITPPR